MKAKPWQLRLSKKAQRELMSLIRGNTVSLRKIILRAAREAGRIVRILPGENVTAVTRRAFYAQRRLELLRIAAATWEDLIPPVLLKDIGSATQIAKVANEKLLAILLEAVPNESAILAQSFLRSAEEAFLDVNSRILNNINLSQSVFNNEALMMGKIDEIVNNGIALGQSAGEIADNVIEHINPDVMGGQRYSATRLGRTEINNAYHRTSIETYKRSPHVLGVQWNLSGSHERDDECDEMDGVVFPKEEVPDKPHPNCFCYLTPIVPEPDEFADQLTGGTYDAFLATNAIV